MFNSYLRKPYFNRYFLTVTKPRVQTGYGLQSVFSSIAALSVNQKICKIQSISNGAILVNTCSIGRIKVSASGCNQFRSASKSTSVLKQFLTIVEIICKDMTNGNNEFVAGTTIIFRCKFYDPDNNPINPDSVLIRFKDPLGAIASHPMIKLVDWTFSLDTEGKPLGLWQYSTKSINPKIVTPGTFSLIDEWVIKGV